MEKKDLSFKPLTEGLGFHPFSDGLPYAPVGKTTEAKRAPSTDFSRGLGATAAGAPTYVPQLPRGRVSVPVAHPTPAANVTANASANLSNVKPPTPASELSSFVQTHYGFGYMLKRLFAYLVDCVFNMGLCVLALSVALWNQGLSPDTLLSPGVVFLSSLFVLVFNWALIAAEEVAFGTTVGKRIFGLALEGSASALFLRAFFFLPSLGFAGFGLLWALVDRQKRCWHDVATDLQPIEIARL